MRITDTQSRHEDAARWLARLHSEDRTDADVAAFRAWLDADEDHRRQFEHVSDVWHVAGGVRDLVRPPAAPKLHSAALSRRAVLAGGAAVIVAGSGLAVSQRAEASVYRTERGEQRRVTLPDGTRMLLDTATEVRVRFDDSERHLALRTGRVHCAVSRDPRPFRIEAGERNILAGEGSFSVQNEGNELNLVSQEGMAVLSEPGREASPSIEVKAGERLRIDEGALQVDRPEISDVVAWQYGRAVFRNETLAEAVAEMNRYSTERLVLDERARNLRISGVYRFGDNAAFARTLCDLLPLASRTDGSEILLTAA